MSNFEEHLFGRIAVLKGYLTTEQLNECLEIQRQSRATSPALIGKVLLSKGYLNQDQLNAIVDIRRKKLRRMLRNAEVLLDCERTFRSTVLAEGLVSATDLESAVLEQHRLHRVNIQVAIWEVVVSKRLIDVSTVLGILARQNLRILVCPSCDLHFSAVSYDAELEYKCKSCDDRLQTAPFLDFVATDGVIEKPSPDERDAERELPNENQDLMEVL